MSKKLLSEGTVRRFMKLADIKPTALSTVFELQDPAGDLGSTTIGPGSEPDTGSDELELPLPEPEPTTQPEPSPTAPAHRDEEGFEEEGDELEISPDVADTVANLIARALNDALPGVNLNVEAEEEEGDLGDMSFEEPEELDEKHRKDARDRGGKGSGRDSGGRRVTPLEEAIREAVVGALQEQPIAHLMPGEEEVLPAGVFDDPATLGSGQRLMDLPIQLEPSPTAEEHGYSRPDLRPGDRYSDYDAATQMADPGWGGPGASKPPLSGYSEYPIPALSPSWEEARLASRRRAMEEAVENVNYIDDERLAENIYRKVITKLTQKRK